MSATSESRPRPSSRILRKSLWVIVSGVAVLAVGLFGFWLGATRTTERQAGLPVLMMAPDYVMTNQLGDKVSSQAFRGKIQLVTFLFPYCTTMCPLIAAHLTNFENGTLRAAGLADKVVIVAFDIDPRSTGPRQMRAFLAQYGWNPADTHWQYLVGTPPEVRRVVSHGFGVWYKRVSLASGATGDQGHGGLVQPEVANQLAARSHVDYDIVHNDILEVVDGRGRVRKIFENADTVGSQELLAVVQALVKSPS
ncbi:MAG: SCO family protein [Pseudomonadota bacterium]